MVADVYEKASILGVAFAEMASWLPGVGSGFDAAAAAMVSGAHDASVAVHDLYVAQYDSRRAANEQETALEAANKRLKEAGERAQAAALAMGELADSQDDAKFSTVGLVPELKKLDTQALTPLDAKLSQLPRTMDAAAAGLKTTWGDVITQFTYEINRPGGPAEAFGNLAKAISSGDGVGGALIGVASQIPGIGTAIAGITETLALFGIDMGAILDQAISGLGKLLGIGGGKSFDQAFGDLVTELTRGVSEGTITEGEATTRAREFLAPWMQTGDGSIKDALKMTPEQIAGYMAQFLESLRSTRAGSTAEDLQQITRLDELVGAVNDGAMTINEAFSELLAGMNLFQSGLEGWRLSDAEEAAITQAFLDAFKGWNPFFGWQNGAGPGDSAMPVTWGAGEEGASTSQTINMYLDGRVIGQSVIENTPEILDVYGVA
jgi:hypothetical protein